MFYRMAISKVTDGNEGEFHRTQSEMNKILEDYGVEVLGYYYCKENNTVYCPANWGSKERLVEIARELQKNNEFMHLYNKSHELSEQTELREVENYPQDYIF